MKRFGVFRCFSRHRVSGRLLWLLPTVGLAALGGCLATVGGRGMERYGNRQMPGHRFSAPVSRPLSLAAARPTLSPARLSEPPLAFERTGGSTAASAQFLARGRDFRFLLTPRAAVLALAPPPAAVLRRTDPPPSPRSRTAQPISPILLRFELVGARAAPALAGLASLPGRFHFFMGTDRQRWRTGVRHYERVRYQAAYPGIDWDWYTNVNGQLEHDFVLAPGADPSRIRLRVAGADRLQLTPTGELLLHAGGYTLRQHRPVIYQQTPTGRRPIAGSYQLHGARTLGFRLAAYDHRLPLVIDPVLSWSRTWGGSHSDSGIDTVVDAAGNVIVCGQTASPDFPIQHPAAPRYRGGLYDAYVLKFNPEGELLWATFLGGQKGDAAFGVAVDPQGNIYCCGVTDSIDWPVTSGAFDPQPHGGFVVKLSPAGDLIYSTYIGTDPDPRNRQSDVPYAIAVTDRGEAIVVGEAVSPRFPTKAAFQPAPGGGASDAFVLMLDADGSGLEMTSYLGGSGDETARGVAIDAAGLIYVVGSTNSPRFPTPKGQPSQAPHGLHDLYVATIALTPKGSELVGSFRVGGRGSDYGATLAIHPAGGVVVAGETYSADFPTLNAYQPRPGGRSDAFFLFLDTRRGPDSAVRYATYLGGAGWDRSLGVAADTAGRAYIYGFTTSPDYPTAGSPGVEAPLRGDSDAFITVLDPALAGPASLLYSSLLGGDGDEESRGRTGDLALDLRHRRGFITGMTTSRWPAGQGLLASGDADMFVARIDDLIPPSLPAAVDLKAVELTASVAEGCAAPEGEVTLTGPAPEGGVLVTLASDHPDRVTVPAEIRVAAAESRARFPIRIHTLHPAATVTLTATYRSTSRSAVLELSSPTMAAVRVEPGSVPGSRPAVGTVTLSSPAPPCGLEVTIVCFDAVAQRIGGEAAATTPRRLWVPAGVQSQTFPIQTQAVYYERVIELRATAGGVTRTAPLTVRPIGLELLQIEPSRVESGAVAWGRVKLEAPAGPGSITVSLTSVSSEIARAPGWIFVPAGQEWSAPFRIDTALVFDEVRTVSFTARANGSARDATLIVDPVPPCAGTPLLFGQTAHGSVGAASEPHRYTFHGQAGGRVLLRFSPKAVGGSAVLQLRDPRGGALGEYAYKVGVTLLFDLPLTGAYCLQISAGGAEGASTEEYYLYLQDLRDPAGATPLAFAERETRVEEAIETPAAMRTYTFEAEAADEVLLQAVRTTDDLHPLLWLFDAEGQEVGRALGLRDAFMTPRPRLRRGGRYVLLVGDQWDGISTGSYQLSLQKALAAPAPLAAGGG